MTCRGWATKVEVTGKRIAGAAVLLPMAFIGVAIVPGTLAGGWKSWDVANFLVTSATFFVTSLITAIGLHMQKTADNRAACVNVLQLWYAGPSAAHNQLRSELYNDELQTFDVFVSGIFKLMGSDDRNDMLAAKHILNTWAEDASDMLARDMLPQDRERVCQTQNRDSENIPDTFRKALERRAVTYLLHAEPLNWAYAMIYRSGEAIPKPWVSMYMAEWAKDTLEHDPVLNNDIGTYKEFDKQVSVINPECAGCYLPPQIVFEDNPRLLQQLEGLQPTPSNV